MEKCKLTERPDIYWAFGGRVNKKILTDCFNELRTKIQKVLTLKEGVAPVIMRLRVKRMPKIWTDSRGHLLNPRRVAKALSDYVSYSED